MPYPTDPNVLCTDLTLLEPRMQLAHAKLAKLHRFRVTETYRTQARQKLLFEQKKSKTLTSKHATGMAMDIFPLAPGGYSNAAEIARMQASWKVIATEVGFPQTAFLAWDSCHFSLNDGRKI